MKLITRLEIFFVVLLFLLAGIVILVTKTLPGHGIKVIFNSYGTSMLPTLSEDNVLILTDQTSFEELAVGDIIVFNEWADLGVSTVSYTVKNEKTGEDIKVYDPPIQVSDSLIVYDETAVFTDVGIVYKGDPGDTWGQEEEHCIHRIVRINENGDRALITKGDNNDGIDPRPVLKSGYLGKVFWYANGLGWPLKVLFLGNSFIWYTGFVSAFTAFFFLLRLYRRRSATPGTTTTPASTTPSKK